VLFVGLSICNIRASQEVPWYSVLDKERFVTETQVKLRKRISWLLGTLQRSLFSKLKTHYQR